MSGSWSKDDEVSRDELERALAAAYRLEMRTGYRAGRVEALLMAVVKSLVDSGVVDRAAFDSALAARHNARRTRGPSLQVLLGPPGEDKYAIESPPDLDCEALLPICQARCCRLVFPLTAQDLEEGVVSWSYRQPYTILRGDDGRCVHQAPGGCHCSIYRQRPTVCRQYDCRKDPRIWTDFEARIPAPLSAITDPNPDE